jgi:hypothetical protein
VIRSENKAPVTKEDSVEADDGSEELHVGDRLSKFFEVLIRIDQRQKRDGKNN